MTDGETLFFINYIGYVFLDKSNLKGNTNSMYFSSQTSIKSNSKPIHGARENILWVIDVRFLKTRPYVLYTGCYNIICVLICTVTGHVSTATVAKLVLRAIYWKARGKPFSRKNVMCIVTISLKFGMYNIIYTVQGGGVPNCVWRRRTPSGVQCFWGNYLYNFTFFSRVNIIL